MSNNIQPTAEQAEEEFGPLWDVLGLSPRKKTVDGRIEVIGALVSAWYSAHLLDPTLVRTGPRHEMWIGVEQARILKQLLLGE